MEQTEIMWTTDDKGYYVWCLTNTLSRCRNVHVHSYT